uniref:Uncharacterized protein n=1 Tax=Panagrolaimus sp. PS1159 TaxID=55785 RepID=A0AC35FQG6_9BILA
MIASLGLMVLCIRKYQKKRKELMQKSDKVLDKKGGAASVIPLAAGQVKPLSIQPPTQHAQKKLTVNRIQPKKIKITGKLSADSTSNSAKENSSLPKKPQPAGKSQSETSTTTTTATTATTMTAPKTKKMPKNEKKSERDVEPTQASSYLDPIYDNKGKEIKKTFVCVNGKDWHEPETGETDDFSHQIESGNTFSVITN